MNKVKPQITANEIVPTTDSYNCYEYFRVCTDHKGDYYTFQHMGLNHRRSEFLSDVDALAYYFKNELGFKHGDVYTVFMPNNNESVIAFYALNKLGVIVNFVHPLLPAELLSDTMSFTKSKGIMLLDSFVPRYYEVLKAQKVPCVLCCVATYAVPEGKFDVKADEEAFKLASESTEICVTYPEILKKYAGKTVEPITGNGSDTAVYLNGGGTTGKSRTIMLSSTALNEIAYKLGANIEPFANPGEYAKIVALPFFHAYGLCAGVMSALNNGSILIPMMRFDGPKFVELLQKNKVYELVGVPNMYKKLYNTPGFLGDHLKHVKYMFAGGDEFPVEFLKEFDDAVEKCGSGAGLCLGYGLTEACAVCCANKNWDYKAGSIGKPVYGNRIEIFDDNQNSLPDGEIGEIAITGSAVMKGYLNEEGRLDDGVYIDEEGTRWILSGDLGYKDEDGFIFFRGRKKRIIIISGYNVYPKDIENLVTKLPFVSEACAVQGYKDGSLIVRLYIVLKEHGDEEDYKRQLIEICEKNLTTFSVPRDVVFIDAIPRTRLEKVDFLKLTEKAPQ